jgi:phospholipid/cholesterol/gamma-HCH transport system ATP-binding protein
MVLHRKGGGDVLTEDRTMSAIAGLEHGFRRVLASGDPAVERLRRAHASVAFCDATNGDALTLDLRADGDVSLHDGDDADIRIEMTDAWLRCFAAGQLNVPLAVVAGDIEASGPVRQYLSVDAILRGLLADHADAGSSAPARQTSPFPKRAIDGDLLAIETRGLHKSFGPNHVLRGIDLAIPEGVISIVLGPSGTGKSVLLEHVIGLMRPDQGDVVIRGRSLSTMTREDLLLLRREIGVMFQDGALYSSMNIYDNVAFPLRQHTDLSEAEIQETVSEHLLSVGLMEAAGKMPGELSGGMRKRAGLARGLVLSPGILLVDEPDSGLDPVRTALLGELLVEQHEQYGGTMLVVTHNVPLAKLIGDHISLVWRGEVLESGAAHEVVASETPFVRQFLAGETVGPLGMDA